jgi:hypothetical protein
MNHKLQTFKYITADYLSALIAWSLFFIYRKKSFYPDFSSFKEISLDDPNFILGIAIIPVAWVLFYFFL